MTPDPAADLPEILTRPLEGNAELRLTVQRDLAERLQHFQAGDGEDTTMLDRRQRRELDGQSYSVVGTIKFATLGRRHWCSLIAFVVLLLAWLAALAMEFPDLVILPTEWREDQAQVVQDYVAAKVVTMRGPEGDFLFPWRKEKTTVKAGDSWRENRSNPAAYLAYVASLEEMNEDLPADYDEVWRRIDPGNAVWLLVKADLFYRRAFYAYGKTRPGRWGVVDPAAFEQMLACLDEASKQPRFDEYVKERATLIRDAFRPPQNVVEGTIIESFVAWNALSISGGVSRSLIEQSIGELATRGDGEGLRRLVAADQRCQLLYTLAGPRGYPMTQVHQNFVLRSLRGSGGSGVQVEEIGRVEKLKDLAAAQSYRPRPMGEVRGASMRDYAARNPPLAVGWLVITIRVAVVGMTGLFLALVVVLRLRQLPRLNVAAAEARCLEPLVTGRLTRAILTMLLPVLALSLCFSGMPLGSYNLPPQMLAAGAYTFVALLTTLVIAGRRELDRRVGFLGFRTTRRSHVVANTVLAVLLLPALLLVYPDDASGKGWNDVAIVCAAANGLALLWLLVKAGIGFFTRDGNVRHRLLARWMVPVCLVWAGGLLCLTGVLHGLERHVFAVGADRWWISPSEPEPDPKLEPALRKLLAEWK
jgi:hypothetical protein